MPHYDVYKDIGERTGGSVYFGIVGPVRTGKSTFISKMTEHLLLPHVSDNYTKQRITDEMPQSGSGSTIMTTQPKFVPESAVTVNIDDVANLSIRMVDCVGYLIDGVQGHMENDKPRMVKTPWFDHDIPFEKAAEIGTKKVISDHSTIGIVMTTDGTITGIPRQNYVKAEEKTVSELKAIGKPFVVILNSSEPTSDTAQALRKELCTKYNVNVILMNVMQFTRDDMLSLLSEILYEFPVKSIDFDVTKWALALSPEHYILSDIIERIDECTKDISVMRDYPSVPSCISASEFVKDARTDRIDLGSGSVCISVDIYESLFYKVLGEECGCEIQDERHLFSMTRELVDAKRHYDRLKNAIGTVKQTGYGIVSPSVDEFCLDRPEMFDQNGKYGVKIRAGAPTLHMIRVDVETEVSPIIGTHDQAEEFVSGLLKQYDEDPESIWDVDIFGKSLSDIITDGLRNKVQNIPDDARDKLQNTLERVVNEGNGGMLFILL